MWVAKIIVPSNDGMLVASRIKKHKLSFFGYPLSSYEKNKKFYLMCAAYLVGDDKSINSFLVDIKKDKRTIKIDMMTDRFGFFLMEQHPTVKILYDPLIIHAKPLVILANGDSIWEIASWDRERIMTVARLVQTRLYAGRVVSIIQRKIGNIAVLAALPELTKKQQQAFDLAVQNGYYGYPRNISMEKLAKIMKISYSTYEFHLRNAEKKLMPYMKNNML